MKATGLPIWVIYDHPSDFPDVFVARKWIGTTATAEIVTSPDLKTLRQKFARLGLHPIDRSASDEAQIVESWI